MKSILNQYHKRINLLEGEKYDLEYEVARKDMEVEKKIIEKKTKKKTRQNKGRMFSRVKQREQRD